MVTMGTEEYERRQAAGREAAQRRWSKTARFIPPGAKRRVEVPLRPGETPYQAAARWLAENAPTSPQAT